MALGKRFKNKLAGVTLRYSASYKTMLKLLNINLVEKNWQERKALFQLGLCELVPKTMYLNRPNLRRNILLLLFTHEILLRAKKHYTLCMKIRFYC